MSPGSGNVGRVWRNVKSRFLMVQRDVVLEAAEAVFRDFTRSETSYPVGDLRRVVSSTIYAVPPVSAGEDARCHRMDCRSAHLLRVWHILFKGSAERRDGFPPLCVTDCSSTISEKYERRASDAMLERTTN